MLAAAAVLLSSCATETADTVQGMTLGAESEISRPATPRRNQPWTCFFFSFCFVLIATLWIFPIPRPIIIHHVGTHTYTRHDEAEKRSKRMMVEDGWTSRTYFNMLRHGGDKPHSITSGCLACVLQDLLSLAIRVAPIASPPL